MPVTGSKRLRRVKPLSITRLTPAIVSELSARLVASTTLPAGLVAGLIARPWAASGRFPCRAVHSIEPPQLVS